MISANMHSVMNSLYAPMVFPEKVQANDPVELFEMLSRDASGSLRKQVMDFASKNGLIHFEKRLPSEASPLHDLYPETHA